MSRSFQEFIDFATETAYLAGKLTLGYFQTGLQPDFKSDDTPVTIADRKAEELIRGRIERQYPDHAIVGEEYGVQETGNATYRWFIDPIDGTKSFVRGIPLYGVLLGLEIEGEVRVGVAYYPALDEMLAAATGLGCWWNGRRARVSEVSSLDRAFVASSDVGNFTQSGRSDTWERIIRATYARVGCGDAYGYLLVATGRAELMLDPVIKAWDGGPFPPILKEAGGYFGDWQGNITIYGNEALATTQQLLPDVLRLMR